MGATRVTREEFIKRAIETHGDQYDYSNFQYVNMHTKGEIYCRKHDLIFMQSPQKHCIGHGCPKCRYEKMVKKTVKNTEWFVEKAKRIHGDKYDYSKSKYVNWNTKVCIICKEHGEFWQTPGNHLNGFHAQGCPVCGRKKCDDARRKCFDDFVKEANKVHDNTYEYCKEEYNGANSMVKIICPIHGVFYQKGTNHICLKQGCPKCSNQMSKNEEEIFNFIKDALGNDAVERRNRQLIAPYEVDIMIPSRNLAIEFDGLIWHSEKFEKDKNYHLNKTNACAKQNVRLIHIFEDEWMFKKEIVKSRLNAILGLTENKIYARKCDVKEVASIEAMDFLDKNHLQGKCRGQFYYGLYYNNELVSLMTFGRMRQQRKYHDDYENKWELLRFCNKLNTSVVGGASKLLNYFIKNVNPTEIISYADKRWSDGNLYYMLGFEHTHDSKPNYFYVGDNLHKKRMNRFPFRKGELIKKGFDPNKSEHEIMLEIKLYRIYDCGTMVFKMKLKHENNTN